VGNLVNQHVRFIESGEFLTDPKPIEGNSLDRLIERKQMSTKTTFKRIALVTVAALGFGMLSVVPSNAIVSGTSSTGSLTATLGTATATPGVTGREMVISVPYTITAADDGDTITVGVNLTAAPSTSSATTSNTYFTTQASSSSIASSLAASTGVSSLIKGSGVAGGLGATGAAVRWAVTDTVTTSHLMRPELTYSHTSLMWTIQVQLHQAMESTTFQ